MNHTPMISFFLVCSREIVSRQLHIGARRPLLILRAWLPHLLKEEAVTLPGVLTMREKRFKTKVGTGESAFLIRIPFDPKHAFGHARSPLWVTVNGYSYRTRVTTYKREFFFPMLREHRVAANVEIGDTVEVAIAPARSVSRRGPRSGGSTKMRVAASERHSIGETSTN